MSKEKMDKTKGITLIALVITIIVLIILAAITVGALTRDNGVMTKAEEAKTKMLIAEIQETVDLWKTEVGTEDDSKIKAKSENELLQEMIDANKIKESNIDRTKKTITIKNTEISYNVARRLTKILTSENYGDYIDYGIDLNNDGNTKNDWKIFLNDGENVYIIASSYVKNTSLPSYESNNYIHKLSNVTTNTTFNEIKNTAAYKKYHVGFVLEGDKENQKSVRYLLNQKIWNPYYKNECAEYSIGGPTIEMWTKSYNEKGYKPLYVTGTNTYGYYISETENSYTEVQSLSDPNGKIDLLYFPVPQVFNSVYGYWIASPSAHGSNYLLRTEYDGSIYRYNHSNAAMSLRPIVCLKSATRGFYEEGICILQDNQF